jgi:hypothetical protein
MSQLRPRLPIAAPAPRWSLQTRLVIAFTSVVAVALLVGGASAAIQLEGYFRDQEQADVEGRAVAALSVVVSRIQAATSSGQRPIVDPAGEPSLQVDEALDPEGSFLRDLADLIAQGDVTVSLRQVDATGATVMAGTFSARHSTRIIEGQSRQPLTVAIHADMPDTWCGSRRPERPRRGRSATRSRSADRSVQTVRSLPPGGSLSCPSRTVQPGCPPLDDSQTG